MPPAATVPMAVVAPEPALPRRSSLRSTLPSPLDVSVADCEVAGPAAVEDDDDAGVVVVATTLDAGAMVEIGVVSGDAVSGTLDTPAAASGIVAAVTVEPSTVATALDESVVVVTGAVVAGVTVDVVAATTIVVEVVVAGTVVVVDVGVAVPSTASPQSPARNACGTWPSVGGGGSNPGGGVADPALLSENDQPSIDPAGGWREPGPTVL
jgi:hypothetical protein